MSDIFFTGYVLGDTLNLSAVDINKPERQRYSIDSFIQETDVLHCNYGAFRHYQEMHWFEQAETASLGARIHFIRSLVERIMIMNLRREQPLTLISLGSGGLLAEYLITRLLADEGFTDLHWRCIDVLYAQDVYERAISALRARTNARVEVFTNVQAYLTTANSARMLAADDRRDSAAVLLSMAPPTMCMDNLTSAQKKMLGDCICIRGNITNELDEANSVNIIFMENNDIDDYYEKLNKGLSNTSQITWLKHVMKCSVDNHGNFDIAYSADKYADIIYSRLTAQLSAIWRSALSYPEDGPCVAPLLGLPHIITAVGLMRIQLPVLPVTLKLFLFNDYDIALADLRAFFRDGSWPTLFASFEKNATDIE